MEENSIEEDMRTIERIKQDSTFRERRLLRIIEKLQEENKTLNKKIDLMENYMVENGWEICFDNIYAELNNCCGMERNWCRGDDLEKEDIHRYFDKKLLENKK